MSATLYARLRDAAIGHVKAYETPKAFDNEAIQQFRAPECVHYLHPIQSIPEPFNQPIKHQQFVHAMEFFGSAIQRLVLDIQDITVDVETRTAVVRILATFDFKAFGEEAEVKDYQAEYMWMTEMNDAGKIIRVEEFMDVPRLMGFVKSRTEKYLAFVGQST